MYRLSVLILALISSGFISAQITNPIPETIKPSGLVYQLEEMFTIPISSGQAPKARINMLREAPDGSDRLFIVDLNGKFWVVNDGVPELYANPVAIFPNFIAQPGKGTGFGAFAFHPEFSDNGILYTAHAEKTSSKTADFSPIQDSGIELQWVVTEWTANNPLDNKFEGNRREILRLDFPGIFHGIQEITFNPTVSPGDEDYGLLYICIGDGASSLKYFNDNLQNTQSFLGSILRIDPLGSNSLNGEYGIPTSNPFVDIPESMGEVWANGFRNPHRISWDSEGDHKMLIGDIGEKHIEEINLGVAGANYGWSQREGTFLYDRSQGQDAIFELPSDDESFNYTYPVAMYDHDEGFAIVGGTIYRGSEFPELDGKYIFGDIVKGRIFIVNADDLEQGSFGEITEIEFVDSDGKPTSLLEILNYDRADLRFGTDSKGELYILTKVDGKVRKLKSLTSSVYNQNVEEVSWLFPNPSNGSFKISTDFEINYDFTFYISNSLGEIVYKENNLNSENKIDLSHLPSGIYFASWNTTTSIFTQRIYIAK